MCYLRPDTLHGRNRVRTLRTIALIYPPYPDCSATMIYQIDLYRSLRLDVVHILRIIRVRVVNTTIDPSSERSSQSGAEPPTAQNKTNPKQQSSRNRNRKAVNPQPHHDTKTKFLFPSASSSLFLFKRQPHQCCVSLLHTTRHRLVLGRSRSGLCSALPSRVPCK